MINTYYFDIAKYNNNLVFLTTVSEYNVKDAYGKIIPITNPMHGSGRNSFDYFFKHNLVIKNLSFKMLGLEGCRINTTMNCVFDIYQNPDPLISPTGTNPVYYDYSKNTWLTRSDFNNNPSLELQPKLLCSVALTDFDRKFPLNQSVNILFNNYMLFSYSLTIKTSSVDTYPATLKLDVTNADIAYNNRAIIIRCYMEIEE